MREPIDHTEESVSISREKGRRPKVLIFSPDMDFCLSLRLLYQDRFEMACTTDPEMLVTMAKTLQPQVVIADCLPTPRMRQRFGEIHKESPGLKVIYFYFYPFPDRSLTEYIRTSGDLAFSKPIDLDEVTRALNSLVMGSPSPEASLSHP